MTKEKLIILCVCILVIVVIVLVKRLMHFGVIRSNGLNVFLYGIGILVLFFTFLDFYKTFSTGALFDSSVGVKDYWDSAVFALFMYSLGGFVDLIYCVVHACKGRAKFGVSFIVGLLLSIASILATRVFLWVPLILGTVFVVLGLIFLFAFRSEGD